MIKLANVRVRSFNIDYLDIYWDVAPCFEDLDDYQFTVLRSDNEFGPFYAVTPPLVGKFHVRDNSIKGQHSKYTRLYYRVQATHRVSGESSYTPELGGAKLAAAPDLVALEMARLNNLRLKEFSGRMVWIFAKRHTGQRCSVCFDVVTQRKMRSGCSSCYDTGWRGGFYAPVETYATIMEDSGSIALGNYPEVNEGDVIVEAENMRWRVGSSIVKTLKARAMIRQQAGIVSVPTNDIEYQLPINIPDSEVKDLEGTPARQYSNPHTLGSAGLEVSMQTIYGKL